jgi:four helix bundle protein
VSDFKRLKVWRKAHALALNIHRVVLRIRGRDSIPLRSQMLRAAISIPANIVEGTAKGSDRELARFVRISLGSTSELEYHLIIARDSSVITKSDFDSLTGQTIEVRKMLYGLINHLNAPSPPPVKSLSS